MKRHNRFRQHRVVILALVATAGILAALWAIGTLRVTTTGENEPVVVFIARGTPFTEVLNLLDQNGLLRSRLLFRAMAHVYNAPQRVKAGEYELSKAMSAGQILRKLIDGDVKKHAVVVPEGFTVRKIAERLAARGFIEEKEFLRLSKDREFLAAMKIPAASSEGFLFPDTYYVDRTMDARTILKTMSDRFWVKVSGEMIAKAREQDLELLQFVTLASIIEKETGLKEEMPLVAAVFRNRLRIGMPLQSDPTVIYGIQNFDGNLTRRHLERQNPYNSYLNRGLPPGPICSPGKDALQAALQPAPVAYLYFVSRNDGSHQFSTTLSEHSRAVRKYQINRKSSGN